LGLLQRRRQIPGVHPRHDLASFDHIASVSEYLRDAPGELGVDVDLLGFDSAITEGDSQR
jgi:hypothetical protein